MNSKLITCGDCDKEISRRAKTCPHCGAKNKKPDSYILHLGKILLGVFIFIGFVSIFQTSRNTATINASNKQALASNMLTPAENWQYISSEDDMSPKRNLYAATSSENEVEFGFPYNGKQRAELVLRTHARYGKDIIFKIQRGQLLCNSYDGCSVLVRFDNAQPVRFSASGSSDHSSTSLFIGNYSKFVGLMAKSKRVRISAQVYQEGSPMFEFDVTGFDSDRYQGKK